MPSSAFFQSISIIGYTLFPLVIASILSAVGIPMIVRIPVYLVLIAWSLAAGVSIMGGSGVVRNRVGIAVYNECNMSDAFRDRHENKLDVRSQVAVDAQVAATRVHV